VRLKNPQKNKNIPSAAAMKMNVYIDFQS